MDQPADSPTHAALGTSTLGLPLVPCGVNKDASRNDDVNDSILGGVKEPHDPFTQVLPRYLSKRRSATEDPSFIVIVSHNFMGYSWYSGVSRSVSCGV